MNKTPEEIVIGLEQCEKYMNGAPEEECCHVCNYQYNCAELKLDALALIRQLEAENAQLKREKGAAIMALATCAIDGLDGNICNFCNHKNCDEMDLHYECFEWRGLCEENGGKES